MENLFFNDNAPSHTKCLFSGQLRFHRSYFFRAVSNPFKQLILHTSQFDTAATFSEQLSFQGNYFFEAATISEQLLLLSNFFQVSCQFGVKLFETTFLSYFFKLNTSMQHQTVWNSYFFNGAISSKEALFQESYFFRKSIGPRIHFFRRVTSYERLLSHRSCFYNIVFHRRYYLTAPLPFHRCTSNRLVIVRVPLTCIDNVKFFFVDLLLLKVISQT